MKNLDSLSLKDKKLLPQLPEGNLHLGGHNFKTHIDEGNLKFAKYFLNCKSMIDVGCGTAWMVDIAVDMGIDAYGVDGDWRLTRRYPDRIIIQDFTKGKVNHDRTYDLGWSTEFVEHVEEQFMPNYMNTFQQCKHVIMTHAPKGKLGHYHVNCKNSEYWVDKMDEYGFDFDQEITDKVRQNSTMRKYFMRANGLYFRNRKL
jgi:hypothetical protein